MISPITCEKKKKKKREEWGEHSTDMYLKLDNGKKCFNCFKIDANNLNKFVQAFF